MNRFYRIREHKLYREAMETIDSREEDRIYCRHGFSHQIDVARISCLLLWEELEGQTGAMSRELKDLVYGAALLHDLGRGMEYDGMMGHEEGSVLLAEEILRDCGYGQEEAGVILRAIASHRGDWKEETEEAVDEPSAMELTAAGYLADRLPGILYKADKLSRNCFLCDAKETCHWAEDKKNEWEDIQW